MSLSLSLTKAALPARFESILTAIGSLRAASARPQAVPALPAPDRLAPLKKAETFLLAQAGQNFPKRRLRIPDLSVVALTKAPARDAAGAANPALSRLARLGLGGGVANDNARFGKRRGFAPPRFAFWGLLGLIFLVGFAGAYLSSRGLVSQQVIVVPDASHAGSAIV